MARTEHRNDRTDASEQVHAVGVFRPMVNDDGQPGASADQPGHLRAADHQREIRHLGRDAARRALLAAVAMGVVVGVAVGVIVAAAAHPGAPVAVGVGLAAGGFAAALGGLWGSFSRFGTSEDWREALTDHDPPARVMDARTGRPVAEPPEAETLEHRGATEIVVEPDSPGPVPHKPGS